MVALCHAPRERVSWNFSTKKSGKRTAKVTLHVSVWVEISVSEDGTVVANVTLHVSVWVEIFDKLYKATPDESRSTWACELKWQACIGCVRMPCHAPRERVSWNSKELYRAQSDFVTLHVSVWVEIHLMHISCHMTKVTLHVSVWVEIPRCQLAVIIKMSRSTWACELKSCTTSN